MKTKYKGAAGTATIQHTTSRRTPYLVTWRGRFGTTVQAAFSDRDEALHCARIAVGQRRTLWTTLQDAWGYLCGR